MPQTMTTLAFFKKFYDHILDFNCEEVIIGGEFNLVFDIEKDKNGGQPKTHKHSLKIVKNICMWTTSSHRYLENN